MNDDENRRLTQKPILGLADNGSGVNIIIVGATARACKEYGYPYIDCPNMLMKAIQTLPKQWREMQRSSIEELTFGALSGQLGCRVSEPAR